MTRPDDQGLLECRWHPTRNNHNLNFSIIQATHTVSSNGLNRENKNKENAKQNKNEWPGTCWGTCKIFCHQTKGVGK